MTTTTTTTTNSMAATTIEHPINPQQQVMMVRSTASGFEQGIAATAGFLTAGPLGSLAAWGALRGLQGKWAPWFILGVPAAVVLNVVNVVALGVIMEVSQPTIEAPVETTIENVNFR